jgi:hypothetical protein
MKRENYGYWERLYSFRVHNFHNYCAKYKEKDGGSALIR